RRVRFDRTDVLADGDPVHGRMVAAARVRALHLGAGNCLVPAEGAVRVLPVRHGQGYGPALPLRPTHAPRLESVPATVAGHGVRGCGGAATDGLGAVKVRSGRCRYRLQS